MKNYFYFLVLFYHLSHLHRLFPTMEHPSLVKKIAHFPDGGSQNFRQLLAKNFRSKKVKGSGKVSCQLKFVVERDGSITEVTVMGPNESFNKEAVRAISLIKTKWEPAKLNGVPVRYRFTVPLTMSF